jgi:hypothetical protein
MPNIDNILRKPAAGVLALLVLAGAGLTACGGSTGSSTTSAAATSTQTVSTGASATNTATSPTTSTPSGGSSSTSSGGGSTGKGSKPLTATARLAALRECLQKNGIPLSKPSPGTKGATTAQFNAALTKCNHLIGPPSIAGNAGAARPQGTSGVKGAGRSSQPARSAVFRQALAKYATCLRQNGINLPAPNPSRAGPIFNTTGVNTRSPQFIAAAKKCRGVLIEAFKRKS